MYTRVSFFISIINKKKINIKYNEPIAAFI